MLYSGACNRRSLCATCLPITFLLIAKLSFEPPIFDDILTFFKVDFSDEQLPRDRKASEGAARCYRWGLNLAGGDEETAAESPRLLPLKLAAVQECHHAYSNQPGKP